MIKTLSLAICLAVASGIALADTIVVGSGSLANVPGNISSPVIGVTNCGVTTNPTGNCGALGMGPYWDNISGDGNQMNVGYILTGGCGISADCPTNYQPLQYLSGAGTPNSPASLSLISTSTAVVTLLEDITGDTSLTFGYYNAGASGLAAAVLSEQPIFGPLIPNDPGAYSPTALALTSGENYGFYLTRSCYTDCPAGDTSGMVTEFSNPTLNSCTTEEPTTGSVTCDTDQHFVIFTSGTTGLYYVGIEDWALLGSPINGETNGDYNDVVFELNSSVAPTPEPASLGLIGAGLAALGVVRFRARNSRA
jgi:hypothetical protein